MPKNATPRGIAGGGSSDPTARVKGPGDAPSGLTIAAYGTGPALITRRAIGPRAPSVGNAPGAAL
eukprot:6891239-Prorocentrum_lima.AAC.1